jgi:hypothetical protein
MKKGSTKSQTLKESDMRPEYDFRSGVRGKHHKDYREGHTVLIHKEDGSTVVQNFKLEEGAVVLDEDVREYFPTSEAVNTALRSLIALIPDKPRKGKLRRKINDLTAEAPHS